MHTQPSKPCFFCPLTCDFVLPTLLRAFTATHKHKNPREHWRICRNTFRRNTSKNWLILRCFGTAYLRCRERTTFKIYSSYVHLKHPSLQYLGHPVWLYLYKDSSPRLMSLELHRYSKSLWTGISAQRKNPPASLPPAPAPAFPYVSRKVLLWHIENKRGEKESDFIKQNAQPGKKPP